MPATSPARAVVLFALTALLTLYAFLGAYQLVQSKTQFASDLMWSYLPAANAAWDGADPYAERLLGIAYLYPPASLLLVSLFNALSPEGVFVINLFLAASIVSALASVALLAARAGPRPGPRWGELVAAAFLLGGAGMLETLWVCQINAFVVLLMAGFLWGVGRERYLLGCACLAGAVALKVTPLALAALLLPRPRRVYLLILAVFIAAIFVAAQLILPVPALTRSFASSLLWVSGEAATYPVQNVSLSTSLPILLQSWLGLAVSWRAVHLAKIALIGAAACASLAVWLQRRTADAERACAATLVTALVVLPNIVWLHHTALLVPALWLLLIEARRRALAVAALAVLLAMQSVRYLQGHLGQSGVTPMACAQLLLLGACMAYTVQAWREGAA